MPATKRRPKRVAATAAVEAAQPSYVDGAARMAASLVESIGVLPFIGGVHGGMPGARRYGQDSPAIITEVQLQTYRGIARWAYEHNEYYGGLIDRLVDYTAGKGFTWAAGKRGWTPDPNAPPLPEIKLAQDTLDDFCEADDWRSRQREEIRRVFRDGESFRRVFAPLRYGELPQCRFNEPEHIICPPSYNSLDWMFGVLALRHDMERHLAYFVRANPEDEGEVVLAYGVNWSEIPGDCLAGLRRGAGCMVHRKESRSDRSVKRGLPLFWGGSDGLEQAESLIDNLTGVAAYLSTIAYFRQHAPGVTGAAIEMLGERLLDRQQEKLNSGIATQSSLPVPFAGMAGLFAGWRGFNDANSTIFGLGPTVKDITNGMQMQPPPVNGNVAGFLSILQARIRAACVLAGVPEFIGSGDASNNNYASIKESGSPFIVATQGRQQDCAGSDQKVAKTILVYSGVDYHGMKVTVTPGDVAMKNDDEKQRVVSMKLADRVMSPQEAIRQDGREPKQVMTELKEWEDQFPDTGPPLQVPGMFGRSEGDGS